MKVIYTGDPIELANNQGLSRLSTDIFGVHFPMSAEVDVSHLSEQQKRKLLTNPHFRAAGVDAPPAALIIPVGVQAARAEATDDANDDAEEAAAASAHAERAAKRKK